MSMRNLLYVEIAADCVRW